MSVQQSKNPAGCSAACGGFSSDGGSGARSASSASIWARACSAEAAWSCARCGVTSRTASTRVGEPLWPKRWSYPYTSSTRSSALHDVIVSPPPPDRGSAGGAATDTSDGVGSSHTSSASSVARVTRSPGSIAIAFVSWGTSRNAATSGGTCHVSESVDFRPQRIRSKPSLRSASASVREVPSVSATAKTRSERRIARLAPSASASRSAASA